MSIIIVLISISVLIAVSFLVAFVWAVKSGQYDDTFSPSVRMLIEDRKAAKRKQKKSKIK